MLDIPEDPREGLTLTQALWAAIHENGAKSTMLSLIDQYCKAEQKRRNDKGIDAGLVSQNDLALLLRHEAIERRYRTDVDSKSDQCSELYESIHELRQSAWETIIRNAEAGIWQIMVATEPTAELRPVLGHSAKLLELEVENDQLLFRATKYPIVFVYRTPPNNQESGHKPLATKSARLIEVWGRKIPDNEQVKILAGYAWDDASATDRKNVTGLARKASDEFNTASEKSGSARRLNASSLRTNLNSIKNPAKK